MMAVAATDSAPIRMGNRPFSSASTVKSADTHQQDMKLLMPTVDLDESGLSHLFRHASEITRLGRGHRAPFCTFDTLNYVA